MKRAVLTLMLLILPYQFAWAAVSIYCNHHEPAGATHFGHHADHHGHADRRSHVLADDEQDPTGKTGLGFGVDHDHYGNTLAVYLAVIATVTPLPSTFIMAYSPKPPNSTAAEPERPNWTSAA